MSAPIYTEDDYLNALQSLMPRGRVWQKELDSVQSKTLKGYALAFARLNDRANNLLVDAFPTTVFELLPEWERTLGIPDSCSGLGQTAQLRRGEVVAKFCSVGAQSVPYMIDYAEKLGYTITITEYQPFRTGINSTGYPLNSESWANAFSINSAIDTITTFQTGLSTCGEPLRSWGNESLECAMEKIKPAHTIINFIYT